MRLRHVPQAKFGLEAAVALTGGAAGDQRLSIDLTPARELRRHVDVGNAFDEGGLIDRREQSAALEVVGDDLRDAGRDLVIALRTRNEIRDRNRDRLKVAFGHGDAGLRERLADRRCQQQSGGRSARHHLATGQFQMGLRDHRRQLGLQLVRTFVIQVSHAIQTSFWRCRRL